MRRDPWRGCALLAFAASAAAAMAQPAGPWPESLSLLGLEAADGFAMPGVAPEDDAGSSVAFVGDINGDGVDDLAVGAPGVQSNTGSVFVVFGRQRGGSGPAVLELGGLREGEGFRLNGVAMNDHFGLKVAGAGDVNDDGVDDLLISAPIAEARAGVVYIVFGQRDPVDLVRNIADLGEGEVARLRGRVIDGTADSAGWSIAGGVDFNGDGIDDLAVGAPTPGIAWVVFGQGGGWPTEGDLRDVVAAGGLAIRASPGDRLGEAIDMGDVNRDGKGDVLVSATRASPGTRDDAGSVYLVYGSADFGPELRLPVLDPMVSTRFDGLTSDGRVGTRVAILGDVNGTDGGVDIAVSRPRASGISPSAVTVRFASGGAVPFLAIEPLWGTQPATGFTVVETFGLSDVGAGLSGGDLDGDGIHDVIVGIPDTSLPGEPGDAGRVYIYFGGVDRPGEFHPRSPAEGVTFISGPALEAFAGAAVDAGGDVNGDGIDDLIIGAPARRGTTPGSAYVVFGRRGQPCLADFDGDGALTIFDFLLFQDVFQSGDLRADFDGDRALTIFDFLLYQTKFEAGCR